MSGLSFGILSLPGNIKDLTEIGTWIHGRIGSFNHASRSLQEMRKFGYDVYAGQLDIQLKAASVLISRPGNAVPRDLINRHVQNLLEISKYAKTELAQCLDDSGNVQSLYFSRAGERNLERILERLAEALNNFQMLILSVDLLHRLLPEGQQMHLTKDRFRLHAQYKDQSYIGKRKTTRLARGEYRSLASSTSDPGEVTVLVEKQQSEERDVSEVQQTVMELSQILYIPAQESYPHGAKGGVMPILGYTTEPDLELVFRVPPDVAKADVATLSDILADHVRNEIVTVPVRLQIAYDIATAVSLVHAARLVHKSIRPDTIIVFHTTPASRDTRFRLFLSEWNLLRSGTGISSRISDNSWTEDIYRHPGRQGLHPEERYHMGHDVYSLGVTLLELGLGEPLVLWSDGKPVPSAIYCRTAETIGCVTMDQDTESRTKSLRKPTNVRRIILKIAENELAERMGRPYAELAQVCLECVEKGIEGRPLRGGDVLEVGDRFQRTIVSPLYVMVREIDASIRA